MSSLEERIAYRFQDPGLLDQALSHRSFRHENPRGRELDNERFEFLGDAILGFLVSRMLFARYPEKREGDLSRLRAHLVSTRHLAGKARALALGRHLQVGRGEERSGGRDKESILADGYESLLAAVYLDGGLEAAEGFVEREFRSGVEAAIGVETPRDDKSQLQEALHARGESEPVYHVIEAMGPDHRKTFEVSVEVQGQEAGRGVGRSKKAAQQAAARQALEALGLEPPELRPVSGV